MNSVQLQTVKYFMTASTGIKCEEVNSSNKKVQFMFKVMFFLYVVYIMKIILCCNKIYFYIKK